MTRLSEEEWIATYREHVAGLYAWVSMRAGADRALAEDVTQEAWLRALADWRRKGRPKEPLAWLRTVARNLILNHFRRRRPERLEAGELDLDRAAYEPATPGAAALLQWGLSRLREGQARLLEAHHLDGKGIGTIATELGLSERAVEGRLRRSRIALRETLSPYFHSQGQST